MISEPPTLFESGATSRVGISVRRARSIDHARPKTSGDYAPLLSHPNEVLFLDIETTGLSRFYDQITVIGYEINGEYAAWIAGDDPSDFLATMGRARSIITFNGSTFDLPFLDDAFREIRWPSHHVDLRYACRRIGLTGGQKAIESCLGIECRDEIGDVDGAMAVILWHRYLRGDRGSLAKLIAYNRADVRAMAHILDHVIASRVERSLLDVDESRHVFALAPDRRRGKGRPNARLPKAPVHLRPAVSFDDLFADTPAENATVLGIDLTGSEKRPSGICILRGRFATTQTLATDDEIVELAIKTKPALVSLDSPLCMPVGRTMVTDDDPYRFLGIMRESERILKRRGINVYPCLLPSMQRLTERGMRLADRIRAEGIPVIECYPGAAQDIIGVPRKGAGIEWLALGMEEFGIEGDFTKERVTHDELDAVTCSMVGLFHLASRSEGLGGSGEEPMIVPKLDADKNLVIGISGQMYSGKTSVARLLEGYGFTYTRISAVIDDVLLERGEKPSRQSRQRVGLELHKQMGQRWLCRRTVERLGDQVGPIVIDGLRWSEDVAYFRERFGGRFLHIHIRAPYAQRLGRAALLGAANELIEAEGHPVESGIAALESLADVVLTNETSISALQSDVGRILGSVDAR